MARPPQLLHVGELNSDVPNAGCRTDCKAQRCGDGIVDEGEECDDDSNGCRQSTCQIPRCGDGVVDTGEQCDTLGTSVNCTVSTYVFERSAFPSSNTMSIPYGSYTSHSTPRLNGSYVQMPGRQCNGFPVYELDGSIDFLYLANGTNAYWWIGSHASMQTCNARGYAYPYHKCYASPDARVCGQPVGYHVFRDEDGNAGPAETEWHDCSNCQMTAVGVCS
eukprot:SAG22_NODE_1277_length_4907_cov_2.638311_1_plen_220_part_00